MRLTRLVTAAAAAFALVGCDIEEPNPAAPGDPPASNASAEPGASAGDPGAGSGGGTGGGGAPTPPPGDPGGGTTPPPSGGGSGGATTPPPTAAVTVVVNLTNMQYKDAKSGSTQTNIKVGDSVQWKNIDSMDHTTTSDTGLWDTPLAQGASFTRKFTTAGSFPYSCLKHKSTMKGTIVVSP